ncbi:MAG: hypothetical protein QXO30_01875 [Candidatus Caldarchaeum sp.]
MRRGWGRAQPVREEMSPTVHQPPGPPHYKPVDRWDGQEERQSSLPTKLLAIAALVIAELIITPLILLRSPTMVSHIIHLIKIALYLAGAMIYLARTKKRRYAAFSVARAGAPKDVMLRELERMLKDGEISSEAYYRIRKEVEEESS